MSGAADHPSRPRSGRPVVRTCRDRGWSRSPRGVEILRPGVVACPGAWSESLLRIRHRRCGKDCRCRRGTGRGVLRRCRRRAGGRGAGRPPRRHRSAGWCCRVAAPPCRSASWPGIRTICPPERATLIDLLHPAGDHHGRSVRRPSGAQGREPDSAPTACRAHRLARGLGERGLSPPADPGGADGGAGVRPAAGAGGHGGIRGQGAGRTVPHPARRCRVGLHQAVDHRCHRTGHHPCPASGGVPRH